VKLFWERLDTRHDRASFDSGTPELDYYLKNQAGQDIRRNLTSICVLIEDSRRIIGYYAISQASLTVDEFPDNVSKKLPPKRNVPCTLLGRLAVDQHYRGQGYGRALLFHALKKAAMISLDVASYAVIVDAKDMKAKEFYKQHGFLELKNQPMRLFMPIRGIREVIDHWNVQN
jgi:GNAT superfamily N-acetyltransferase